MEADEVCADVRRHRAVRQRPGGHGPVRAGAGLRPGRQWFADHADKITGWKQAESPETATTVRLDGGEPVITDGPFVEGKEVVSGFAEIEVADLDEALRMVRTWPGCPVVEIRPLES